MGYPRRSLVSINDTPYYHVIVRCVRQAWLWGLDEHAGRDYSHRKSWLLERLQTLGDVYAIDVCAYAVMSNHYHLVLHVDRKRVEAWKPESVVRRWSKLFALPLFVQSWAQGEAGDADTIATLALIEEWRERLYDVSWFMRSLNENLARRANAEEACAGRFWEGRFKSQALTDELQLLTAMAYVDLNPIRAGVALTPENSDFTSIHARVLAWDQERLPAGRPMSSPVRLMGFRDQVSEGAAALPLRFIDYLRLVDWTGRVLRPDKCGAIPPDAPPILQRLGVEPETWSSRCQGVGRRRRSRTH